jgi:hypothetical protein
MKSKQYLNSIIIFVALTTLFSGCKQTEIDRTEEIKDGEAKGQIVIDAIELYRTENHTLPEKIEDLIPDYLPQVPKTITGNKIEYKSDGIYYIVEFGLRKRGDAESTCVFDERLSFWDCSFYVGE